MREELKTELERFKARYPVEMCIRDRDEEDLARIDRQYAPPTHKMYLDIQ